MLTRAALAPHVPPPGFDSGGERVQVVDLQQAQEPARQRIRTIPQNRYVYEEALYVVAGGRLET
eukprot:4705933-Pyramimonas_sp.AAC.1